MGLSLPGLALAEQLYLSARAHGLGRRGTHALQLAVAELSGLKWPGAPVRES
jgi:3-hydroxyisobutyrate dehydrogenase